MGGANNHKKVNPRGVFPQYFLSKMSLSGCAVFKPLSDVAPAMPGKIRTLGYATNYDAGKQMVELQYEESRLLIDVRLVQPFSFTHGQLLMVIGEMRSDRRMLRAMIYRVLDGLDVPAYLAAMRARARVT